MGVVIYRVRVWMQVCKGGKRLRSGVPFMVLFGVIFESRSFSLVWNSLRLN